jgi:hypothetical protein
VRRLRVATCDGDGDGLPMGWSHIGVEKSTTGYEYETGKHRRYITSVSFKDGHNRDVST